MRQQIRQSGRRPERLGLGLGLRITAMSLLASSLLAGCGGHSDGGSTVQKQERYVHVFGDSLSDSGTFGLKYTVQGPSPRIFADRVALDFGISALCPYMLASSPVNPVFSVNPKAGCTNYAVGGGRINYPPQADSPLSIRQQLALAAAVRPYTSQDLLLINGGGNDAAAFIDAFLLAQSGSKESLMTLATALLSQTTVDTSLTNDPSGTDLGKRYMVALAQALRDAVQTHALAQNASKVVLLNMPDVTQTPRFVRTLANASTLYGQTKTDAFLASFMQWIDAYNAELASQFSGSTQVLLIDFHGELQAQLSSPQQYSLQNISTPACPEVGTKNGLPSYNLSACTETLLSSITPPAGATGGSSWWKTYAFSDHFHPTPYGHQLIYQRIAKDLRSAGWL